MTCCVNEYVHTRLCICMVGSYHHIPDVNVTSVIRYPNLALHTQHAEDSRSPTCGICDHANIFHIHLTLSLRGGVSVLHVKTQQLTSVWNALISFAAPTHTYVFPATARCTLHFSTPLGVSLMLCFTAPDYRINYALITKCNIGPVDIQWCPSLEDLSGLCQSRSHSQ